MNYNRPTELKDALSLIGDGEWSVLSGGTDFYPALGDAPAKGNILDITAIKGMRSIVEDEEYWRIGALSTWTDVINADLPAAFDGLKLAAREIGSVQIQNRATIAGNICNASPAADGLPPLLTLDARVRLSSTCGSRDIALAEFVTGNRATELQRDELLTDILIPKNSTQGAATFIKLGARKYLVISISMVSVRLCIGKNRTIDEAAISVGSCSAVAVRLSRLEAFLKGKIATTALIDQIDAVFLDDLSPIDDVRATGSYRSEASLELVRRAVQSVCGIGS